MNRAPAHRVVINLDCQTLGLEAGAHCDLLFVGEDESVSWVAPIELKSGRFDGRPAAVQLQGGADAAEAWLPIGGTFHFVPILVHGKGVHRTQQKALRRAKVRLRGHTKQPVLIRCGERIGTAFVKSMQL